jgi:preprotein translocase subunit Sss1
MQLMNVQAAEEVSIKAEEMRHQADVFRKTARDTKLHFCWQHYKLILLVLLILGVVGVVIWLIITGGKTGN